MIHIKTLSLKHNIRLPTGFKTDCKSLNLILKKQSSGKSTLLNLINRYRIYKYSNKLYVTKYKK